MMPQEIQTYLSRLNSEIDTIYGQYSLLPDDEQNSEKRDRLEQTLKNKMITRNQFIMVNSSEVDYYKIASSLIYEAVLNCLRFTLYNSSTIQNAIKHLHRVGFSSVEISSWENKKNTFITKAKRIRNVDKKEALLKYQNLGKWIMQFLKMDQKEENEYAMDYTWVMVKEDKECYFNGSPGLDFNFCCYVRNLDADMLRRKVKNFSKLTGGKIIQIINIIEKFCPSSIDFEEKYQEIFPNLFDSATEKREEREESTLNDLQYLERCII